MEGEVDAFFQWVAGNLRINGYDNASNHFHFNANHSIILLHIPFQIPSKDFLENLIHSCCHFAKLSFIVINVNMTNIVMLIMIIMCTVNDEYVKLFVWQPAGGSGGPEGTRRNEHGWPLVIIIMMIMITMTKMIIMIILIIMIIMTTINSMVIMMMLFILEEVKILRIVKFAKVEYTELI